MQGLEVIFLLYLDRLLSYSPYKSIPKSAVLAT